MADSIVGVKFSGGVIIAADQSNAHSILVYQSNLDKIPSLTSHSMLGCSGPNADIVNFSEFIAKNLELYRLSNDDMILSPHAQANFARGELAKALRKGPFQVNALLGGYDVKSKEGELYWMDYLGTLQKVNFGAQGYAGYFVLSTMDREWKEGMTEAEALQVVKHSISNLATRLLINQPNWLIKVVDEKGVRTIEFGADPADC